MREFHAMLGQWETFCLLVGTAGATLAGLMFVTLTVAQQFRLVIPGRMSVLRSHSDPALLAFILNLVLGAVLLMPSLTRVWFGALLILLGLASLAYMTDVLRRLIVSKLVRGWDASDWSWYAAAPVLGGIFLLGSGALSLSGHVSAALTLLASTLLLLLAMGIRNAWDLVTFAIGRSEAEDAQPKPGGAP